LKKSLQTLVEIQKVDLELQDLEAQKGDLPQRLQALHNQLEQLEASYEGKKQELTQTVLDRRHWESETRRLEELQKKTQDKLYSVTTNREYDAITLEIEETQNLLSEAETRVLELLDDEEKLKAEVAELEQQVTDLRQQVESKETELRRRIEKTEAQVRELTERRQELLQQIPQQVLSQYERIRRGKGAPAVVSIIRGACAGCQSMIPPQRRLEVRQMNQLIFCEACGRILVWTNGSE
jgi:predicted  nucleic acid-binding Zn-ribbon protein